MNNQMRRWMMLCEGPQGGTLYHATDVLAAARILLHDEIKARTDHLINAKVSHPGVSLTRSFRFAADWNRFGVIFVLDGDRLRTRHRLLPVDYYHDRREHEEFLIGAIKPLTTYLTGILITPETVAYCQEHDADLIEGHKDYDQLLQHSLLRVIKFPAPVRYVNPRKLGTGMFAQVKPQ